MPSAPRDESPGYHHVWCRGNNKRPIVLDARDRRTLLEQTDTVARRFGWKVLAYCLMDNHYHLVIEIDERGMSRGFCRLNTGYATTFNKRHGRMNHLFGKRYGSKPIEDEASLLETCRYVLMNPVRAGLVKRPQDYRWSSFRATLGEAYADIALSVDQLLGSFHRDPRRARALFAEFVARTPPAA